MRLGNEDIGRVVMARLHEGEPLVPVVVECICGDGFFTGRTTAERGRELLIDSRLACPTPKPGDRVTFDSIGVPHKATVADGKAGGGDGWVLVNLESCGDLCQIPIDQIQYWTSAEDGGPTTCGVPDTAASRPLSSGEIDAILDSCGAQEDDDEWWEDRQ